MHFYNGPIPGDERPVGGGRYNESKIGGEVYNFRETRGYLYGYFQPAGSMIALERIDPECRRAGRMDGALVVFVARHRSGGQFIVGWYKDAEILRNGFKASPGKPPGYGHYCSAERPNCFLLREGERNFPIPGGKGGMGQRNVCYPLTANGARKSSAWMRQALSFIDDYQGSNILDKPEADAEIESTAAAERALARSKGQGFARTPQERRAIEERAMAVAKGYFRRNGFEAGCLGDPLI
jgi:hypothetical protein